MSRRDSSPHGSNLICNPYDQDGYFSWIPENPHEGEWVPAHSPLQGGCPVGPKWIDTLREASEDIGPRPGIGSSQSIEEQERWKRKDGAAERLSWLHNRTILIVGDSVDRNAMDHLGFYSKSAVIPTDYHDATFMGKPEGWDIRGVPHVVHMDHMNTLFSNVFFYGTDEEDLFRRQNDWHAPGRAEDRLSDLFLPFTQQLKHPPSFIQFHSGMWDLAFFGRQDAIHGRSTQTAIEPERIQWWLGRIRSIVGALRQTYPGVPIWFRTLHRVGTQIGKGSEDYIVGVEREFDATKQNFFTDLRCGQIREMQIAIAKELCLPIIDFGQWWEGYQLHQDKVHPNPTPGGLVYLTPLLHAIWMEAQGRETWEQKPCSANWTVDDQLDFASRLQRETTV